VCLQYNNSANSGIYKLRRDSRVSLMQASYEVSLHGSFPGADLGPILQRITLRSSSSKTINWKEIAFDPIPKPSQSIVSNLGNDAARKEQVRLICRKDLDVPKGGEAKW